MQWKTFHRCLARVATVFAAAACAATAIAQPATPGDRIVLDAREALRKGDARALADAKRRIEPLKHPLAPWVDYWELSRRLREVTADEVEAFYARWPDTYVEDRLRNDWLLELGRRRDWDDFRRDLPRFRMNDDRQVACYALVAAHLEGRDVGDAARAAWFAQRDADDGCHLLARTLLAAGVFGPADVWRKARLATEQQRAAAARQALTLLAPPVRGADANWWDQPEATLDRTPLGRRPDGLDVLALARLAALDAERAARRLEAGLAGRLEPEAAAWAWAQTARWTALRLQPQALERYAQARAYAERAGDGASAWSDDTLAWQVRAALRSKPTRWDAVRQAIDAMTPAARSDPAWVYWGARADLALAADGEAGEAQRSAARQALASIAGQMHFYGKLAAEDLGRTPAVPPAPAPLSAAERAAAQRHPGLARALHALALGLRSEGVREWNFSLIGMGDRELLAAAHLACSRAVWDRCINTSERTRAEVDLAQRFPTPFRDAVVERARDAGLDPALVYGLIRQESRFVTDARSGVGASGLMQVMPATARWVARRLGLTYTPQMIDDLQTNLRLGTTYLRLVLDDFGGSPALATAAYNAGPGRPRRWRDGPELEPAMWAETIPFNETRDYVKKVLSNAAYYAVVLGSEPPSLKARLGPPIGPRPADAPPANDELP
ncbi:lytic transglycosylase domain-containing protein [Azohydromonas sediminis]|uniref:lytic transglycosylase domain-containing protein n=1 Tax=Azohydromonas sediminis TaxID=2259674 RepID=UPI000E64F8C3|nr:lytic transglycosylase domain-containing protein [Azohydromonas sediminis]